MLLQHSDALQVSYVGHPGAFYRSMRRPQPGQAEHSTWLRLLRSTWIHSPCVKWPVMPYWKDALRGVLGLEKL